MTRPTQLVLLFAVALGALILGASFGAAQQVPATAAPPASANPPSAPGNGPSAGTPAPAAAQPPPASAAPAPTPPAPVAAPAPANTQVAPAPAATATPPAPAHAPPTSTAAPPAPASAQPAPAATRPTPAITLNPADLAFIDRVTWGANESTAAEFVALGRDRWLERQLHSGPKDRLPAAAQAIINGLAVATRPLTEIAWPLAAQQRNANQIPDAEQKKTLQQAFQQSLNELGRQAATRSLVRDLYSPDQLREKMTWFWFNHFNVHLYKSDIRETIGDYEEQLRRHALGHFRDLLRATAVHPAMLRYLDNAENAKSHINENYAREIMELHTMGVGSGYTQEDVQELARILTGVGVNFQPPDANAPKLDIMAQPDHVRAGLFEFNPARHDYGVKHFLGHTIEGRGFAEVEQALDILARHPATAAYVSRKIATYFMSDTPPDALVQRMAQSFRTTDGDIVSVLLVMFKSPEFMGSLAAKTKYKDPMQFVLSAVRLAYDNKVILNAGPIIGWLNRLAEGLYNHPTPDGYPMTAAAWNSPGQMATRFEIARAIGSNAGGMFKAPPPDTAERPAFPQIASAFYFNTVQPTLSQATRSALDQAGSPQEWNALFLSSPEFMR
jgi:uncharacterized protein (DUF1800 family)